MNKISPLAFTLCLALAGMQVSAENWIKNADGSPSWIDTDSIRQEQAISSFDMRLESSDFTVVSTMEFDTSKTPGAPPRLSPVTKTEKSSTRKRKKILTTAGTSSCPAPMERICTGIMWKRPCPRLTRSGNSFTKNNRGAAFSIDTNSLRYKMAMPTSGLPWKSLIRKRIYPGSFTG